MPLTRRALLLSAGATLLPTSNLAQTLAPDTAERLTLGHQSGLLDGLHAVLVLQNGEPVLEAYFPGEDENWGRPLDTVDHGPDTLHDLRSVSKSITSLLYDIAFANGDVPPPEAPLLDAFPQYPDLAEDPIRASWTIAHAFNMTLGTEWNENLPYTDPANSEIAMEQAPDRYRFILDRPIVSEPGTAWNYNGGCTALLGYLIEQGTGQLLDAFAQQALFAPLGIDSFHWNAGADGTLSAASGLRLTAPSLARIGEAIRSGNDILPQSWLDRYMTPQTQTSFGLGYSHQWYLGRQPVPATGDWKQMLFAQGNGGQRLYVIPDLNLTAVTFSGNYNTDDQWLNPTLILRKIILNGTEA